MAERSGPRGRDTRARVIGIGRPGCGDDALGLLVARRLRADPRRDPARVEVVEHAGDGMTLVALLEGAGAVVLVDACVGGGGAPGSVLCLEATRAPLPARLARSGSTHRFGVAEAVELARVTGRLPPTLWFLGAESAGFLPETAPSAAVAAAVPALAERSLRLLLGGRAVLRAPTRRAVRASRHGRDSARRQRDAPDRARGGPGGGARRGPPRRRLRRP